MNTSPGCRTSPCTLSCLVAPPPGWVVELRLGGVGGSLREEGQGDCTHSPREPVITFMYNSGHIGDD